VKVVLSNPALRIVLGVTLIAHFSVWMGEVAMTWTMASLGASPLAVALMQSATTLPLFLLGLPSGAVADMLDKRRLLIATQLWLASGAVLLALATVGGAMSPPLLLALACASGCGLAMRLPLVASLVPRLVKREQLAEALGFNAISYNVARIFGPLLAGVLIVLGGSLAVFVTMAVLSLLASVAVIRWTWSGEPARARTALLPAMREGLLFVSRSRPVRPLVLRITLFFFHSCALTALLPLIVQRLPDARAVHYTLMLSCMGVGGVLGVMVVAPLARRAMSMDALVTWSIGALALAMLLVAWSSQLVVMGVGMALAGLSWLVTANSLTVATQVALPDHLRARGMALYQSALMGGTALGAACWGKLAEGIGIAQAVSVAALMALASALSVARWSRR